LRPKAALHEVVCPRTKKALTDFTVSAYFFWLPGTDLNREPSG